MAALGALEGLLGPLKGDIKSVMMSYTRAWCGQLRFGAPRSTSVPCENFGGHMVPFTTDAVANNEVAIAHRLDRVPRLMFPVMPADVVNATIPTLVQTRVADNRYLYLSSPTTGASCWIYVE